MRAVRPLQKMSSPALEVHDVCGSKVTKLMSASAFAFKGSGFYITDYKGRNSAAITGKGDKAEREGGVASPAPKSDACATCPAEAGRRRLLAPA